jgi:hypothetical protein
VNSSKELTAMLLARVESLAEYLFPKGHKEGASWRVGSLDINLRTGMWGDWDGSTQRMSRNLVNLWIYASRTDFKTAISEIRSWLGVPDTSPQNGVGESNRKAEPRQAEGAKKFRLPLLDKPNRDELLELSHGRSIALEPLRGVPSHRLLVELDHQNPDHEQFVQDLVLRITSNPDFKAENGKIDRACKHAFAVGRAFFPAWAAELAELEAQQPAPPTKAEPKKAKVAEKRAVKKAPAKA